MILTITPNSALDRVIFIDEFRPETVMRSGKVVNSVGGKGLDASVVLRALGVETVGLSFVAGITGQQLVGLLEDYGIGHDLIWVEGETRIAHVLIETRHNRHSHVMAGALSVSPEACEESLQRFRSRLAQADWVIAGGSLAVGVPISYYRSLSEMAREEGVPILIDSAGEPILEALPAHPTVLKMNRAEFAETFGVPARPIGKLKEQTEEFLRRWNVGALVLTLGKDGILAHTPEGAYHATAPSQKQINAAGAGDAVSAALTWRFSLGDAWPEALRWAAAAGAAVVLTEGTADCYMVDIKRILPETDVQPV